MAECCLSDDMLNIEVNEENKSAIFRILGIISMRLCCCFSVDEKFYQYCKNVAPLLKPLYTKDLTKYNYDIIHFVINCYLPYVESEKTYTNGLHIKLGGENMDILSPSEYFLLTRAYILRDFDECPGHWLKLDNYEFSGVKEQLCNRLWEYIGADVRRLLNKAPEN